MTNRKANIIKRTTKKRSRRLHLAKEWISAYPGKNMVTGYAKHFKVDIPCAIKELRLLGIAISEQ